MAPAAAAPAGAKGPALTRADLAQVFLRSFLFQSMWSFQRMQNVGWLFSLWPVFRRLYPDQGERARAAQSHADYFNTHPYTADIILGVVAGMEERLAAGDSAIKRDAVIAAKKTMAGPLSALGETLFWATLRPLLLVAAAVAGALSQRNGWWVTTLVYLGIFNILHVGVRAGGLWMGYHRGMDVAAFLVQWPFQRWAARASWLGLGMSAGVLGTLLWLSPQRGSAVLLAVVALLCVRRGGAPHLLPVLAAAAGFLAVR